MGRTEWLTVAITLLSVWLTWYMGNATGAIVCGLAGAVILVAILFSRRGNKHSQPASSTVQQTANPVMTQTASPTINVNLGNSLPSQPAQQTQTIAKPQPNIRFVEAKSVQIHAGDGTFFESPQGLGDYRVGVACFRNEAMVGRTLKQPSVKAHVIFKDSAGAQVSDISSGVWLDVYEDAAPFTVGTKRCVILFLLTNQGILKRLWKESYVTEHSWMGGPSFRVRDEVIAARIADIEINLLEDATGTCLVQANFSVEGYSDGELPALVLRQISPAQ